jgi:A/G-specific adenine glycosylase
VRQRRAELLRIVLAQPGLATDELVVRLNDTERAAGRVPTDAEEVRALLEALAREGFLAFADAATWRVAD